MKWIPFHYDWLCECGHTVNDHHNHTGICGVLIGNSIISSCWCIKFKAARTVLSVYEIEKASAALTEALENWLKDQRKMKIFPTALRTPFFKFPPMF
jgi:hypothetical protein